MQVNQYHFAYLNNGDLRRALDFFTAKTDAALVAKGLKPGVPVPDKGIGQPAISPTAIPKSPKAPTQAPTPAPTQTPVPLPIVLPTQAPTAVPVPRPTSPIRGAPSATSRPRPPSPQPTQGESPIAPLNPELQESADGAISDDGDAEGLAPRPRPEPESDDEGEVAPRPRPEPESEDEIEAAPRPAIPWLNGPNLEQDEEEPAAIPVPWLAGLEESGATNLLEGVVGLLGGLGAGTVEE
jgi:hypothetical protein